MMVPEKFFDRFKEPDRKTFAEISGYRVITDFFGDEIYEEDGVFEVTFEHWEVNSELWTAETNEHSEIATQANIVDLIEEFGADNLKHIEFVGLGKEYMEVVKNG
ncbi:hypothetical protein [Enterococcus songbeiensis]|uniref:hypothetical protein n=1 Tax=Enterococcus songbeiensis TaxID=2559927 RepID=UPI0010F6D756|nr:hypothetical protein [Enterococcus songbeiensis]